MTESSAFSATPRLAFIGAGNMGGAILRGLVGRGYPAASIVATGRDWSSLQQLAAETGVQVTRDNQQAVAGADAVVLCVKPQVMAEVCPPLAERLQPVRPLVFSIAAGITTASLNGWLGEHLALVRAMPNTPALLGAGMTGLYATPGVTPEQKRWSEQLFAAVGEVCWVDTESQLDAVTAVSGSGPAYYFLLTEALAAAGAELGLPPQTALQLARQTARGAGLMLTDRPLPPAELRRQVTSPGGTTAAALAVFEQGGLTALVRQAAEAAAQRAAELAAGR